MRIRSHQIYLASELYSLYKAAYESKEVFDAFTLNLSVYIEPQRFLEENEFRQICRRTQLNQYTHCATYDEYKKAQREHINVVLPNNVVLTIFTDYSKHEFEKVLSEGFVKSVGRKPLKGLAEQIYNSNKIGRY